MPDISKLMEAEQQRRQALIARGIDPDEEDRKQLEATFAKLCEATSGLLTSRVPSINWSEVAGISGSAKMLAELAPNSWVTQLPRLTLGDYLTGPDVQRLLSPWTASEALAASTAMAVAAEASKWKILSSGIAEAALTAWHEQLGGVASIVANTFLVDPSNARWRLVNLAADHGPPRDQPATSQRPLNVDEARDLSAEPDVPELRQAIVTISKDLWGWIIGRLSRSPEDLHTMHPRKFEELVAELLDRDGYDVQLTPSSGDGGRDILARHHDSMGSRLYLVECKRYRPDRPVEVHFVRSLFGVVAKGNATAGMLVTTSHFSSGAIKLRDELQYRLTLKDFGDLTLWLARHASASKL